jgi:transcriptional regulator with XRE-family HTH domain
MKDILKTITSLREARGWTEYQLAESSGLPQSTISSWYRKNMIPSVPSLAKICSAFGITLSQLFAEDDAFCDLTEGQKELLKQWACLTKEQQEALLQFMKTI